MNLSTVITFLSIVFLSTVSLLFSGCASESSAPDNPGTISGQFSGVSESTPILLRSFKNGALVKVGGTETDSNGNFSFTPDSPLKKGYHQLILDKRWPVVLITDSTEAPIVTATIPDETGYLSDAEIKGSPTSELLATFYIRLMPLQDSLLIVQKSLQLLSGDAQVAATKSLKTIIAGLDKLSLDFIKQNPESPATLAALENLDPKKNGAAYKAVIKSLSKTFADSHYYAMLKGKYDASISSRTIPNQSPPAKKQTRKNGQFGVGDEALDIVMEDPDGNIRKLSDLRGKVVLIDFWSSWCGPCRRENPNVVRAYNEFNSKGFEVFSVSLDSNKDKWLKAIEKDGLIWPNHVCDLKGWQNVASRAYGISSIPHTVLVGRDGIIVKTHLRGRALDLELEKLLD
jgi:peroxiredoxin